MIVWLLLLALVVFLIYMWQNGGIATSKEEKPGCNTCPNKKNPSLL